METEKGLVTLTCNRCKLGSWDGPAQFDAHGLPMLALGYPLFVTIRAIEAGCVYDKRKVATYWIMFSLIYLFENVFAKFLEWVPLWSYLRLVFMCWLVIPHLNGAFYLYQNLVHPYLQFKLPNAIIQLCAEWHKILKNHSVSINNETFLAVAESCLDENDSLIASKPECNEGGQILGDDIQEMECTAKCNAVESIQIENISTSAIQVISKPVIPAVAILPATSSLAVFQTRWTCEICEVTVRSELTLQSHLRGRKHRAEAMLWCTFCNLRVSGEIDMIAHLKGKRHLTKLQETFTNSGAS
ncbi:uncharacterized protein LOC125815029 [Solanum verrucosum]|uniref:uncharacterized protein LOC125815029 n=1 Tax=Solanum verrucosum TaxID=315347 RepID=UPI0020D0FC8C|nr:uncharacterized protein LOC125815029 [Solanum verrucosum]